MLLMLSDFLYTRKFVINFTYFFQRYQIAITKKTFSITFFFGKVFIIFIIDKGSIFISKFDIDLTIVMQ